MHSLCNTRRRGLLGRLGLVAVSVLLLGGAAMAQTPAPPAGAAAPAPSAAPSPSGEPPAPAAPGAAPAVGGGSDGAYTVRLRSLEKNVNELKEQIFRTKA